MSGCRPLTPTQNVGPGAGGIRASRLDGVARTPGFSGLPRHLDGVRRQRDDVSGSELPTPPRLDLAVHGDEPTLDDLARCPTVVHEARELEQLAQPDRLVTDGDLQGGAHPGQGSAGAAPARAVRPVRGDLVVTDGRAA